MGILIVLLCWLGLVLLPAWAQATPGPDPRLTWVGAQPQDLQTALPVDQPVILTFDQPLPATLQELAIDLSPNTPLGFQIQGSQLILQPDPAWQFSATYTLTLESQEQLPLTQPITYQFRTVPQFTYVRDVEPLLRASCVGCHYPQGRMRAKPLDTYEAVMAYVKPGDPGSVLIQPRWTNRHATVLRTRLGPDGTVQPTGRSPEVAFNLRNGIPLDRLGFWRPEEVEIVRTWIVQDRAVASSE
ncbi:MAG: Ig-like domain-containing protein [Thermostichales cyanobacterium SZTDM-1c_bins_54]